MLNIPEKIRRRCLEKGVGSKSLLLQVARQVNEKKMDEMLARIVHSGLTRDEARRERRESAAGGAGPRPQPFLFHFQPENESFRLRLQFRKSHVSREELIAALRGVLAALERGEIEAGPTAA